MPLKYDSVIPHIEEECNFIHCESFADQNKFKKSIILNQL